MLVDFTAAMATADMQHVHAAQCTGRILVEFSAATKAAADVLHVHAAHATCVLTVQLQQWLLLMHCMCMQQCAMAAGLLSFLLQRRKQADRLHAHAAQSSNQLLGRLLLDSPAAAKAGAD